LGLDGDAALALDHVQMAAPAGCEAAARRFYGELLGLHEVQKPDALQGRGGVWFALASGAQLHVGVADPFGPALKAHPGLRASSVAAIEVLADRLRDGGFAVTWNEELTGVRRFFTADPFGNRLEVLTDETS
jgi:catechol 2,3-dioxygenase-like lactoylglutathione lyase family enzyme